MTMNETTRKVVPFLWFDGRAEETVSFYQSVFGAVKIGGISRMDATTASMTGQPEGNALTIAFELFDQPFVALNGGHKYQFTPAVSFLVNCDTQEEVDRYWAALSAVPEAEQCGWLVDKYGVSWQIVPTLLPRLMGDPDPEKAGRVTEVMLRMKKIDMAALQRAYDGD